jgi:hypothetical protein
MDRQSRRRQIIITNPVRFPFCFANTPGTACVDVIDGFDFKFTGETSLVFRSTVPRPPAFCQ